MRTRRDLIALGLGVALGPSLSRVSAAQGGAELIRFGNIRMNVGFPAGGITDSIGRLVAEGLSQALGRSVVVENRGGAGGNIASAAVARSDPDGLTLLMGTAGTHAINPHLYQNLPFDSVRDFTPIAYVASSGNVLVANPKFPAGNVRELIDYMRGRSEPLQMAIPGFGTTPHMAGELLKREAGINIQFVPYRGGGPAMTDVMAGVVPIMFEATLTATPQVRGGTVKALGISSPDSSSALPEVPAIAKTLPGFDAQGWWGVFAPPNMSKALVDRLHAAVETAVRLPAIAAKFRDFGVEVRSMSQDQFANLVAADLEKWGRVIKDANIKIQ